MDIDVANESPQATPITSAQPFPWLNVALFLATGLSTLVVGTVQMTLFEAYPSEVSTDLLTAFWTEPTLLLRGLGFSLALMSILLSHEMGHYLTCRYYRISASLPYFIPAPTPVGTFGAFIRIRSPIHHRSALLDVGIAGPIAGFLVSLPVLAFALMRSRYVPLESSQGMISLGEPLVFKIFTFAMGAVPPDGMELYLHPVGFAAWVGFLLTALNLLPVGQLDGGHISYALFQGAHRRISLMFLLVLVPLAAFYWIGWLVWIVLLLFVIGTRHPPTLNDERPLEPRHTTLGWVALAMFILSFTPAPIVL
jgi:membrane-associated protease RseP (regulator of RpoE activity)